MPTETSPVTTGRSEGTPPTFQDVIVEFCQRYWGDAGAAASCSPTTNEVGAGTFAPGHHAALARAR